MKTKNMTSIICLVGCAAAVYLVWCLVLSLVKTFYWRAKATRVSRTNCSVCGGEYDIVGTSLCSELSDAECPDQFVAKNGVFCTQHARSYIFNIVRQRGLSEADVAAAQRRAEKLVAHLGAQHGNGPVKVRIKPARQERAATKCGECGRPFSMTGTLHCMLLAGIEDRREFVAKYGVLCVEHAGDLSVRLAAEKGISEQAYNDSLRRAQEIMAGWAKEGKSGFAA